jgi:hypothetical protein
VIRADLTRILDRGRRVFRGKERDRQFVRLGPDRTSGGRPRESGALRGQERLLAPDVEVAIALESVLRLVDTRDIVPETQRMDTLAAIERAEDRCIRLARRLA